MKNRSLGILVLALFPLCLLTNEVAGQGPTFNGGPATVTLRGPAGPVELGGEVLVDVSLSLSGMTSACSDGNRDVALAGYSASFSFDPTVMRFVEADVCPGAPIQYSSVPSFTNPNIANERGSVAVVYGHAETRRPTGSFCLVRLRFEAHGPGTSQVTIPLPPLASKPQFVTGVCGTGPVEIPLATIVPIVVTVSGGSLPPLQRVVPIVLDVVGRGGARFSSELTLVNRGAQASSVELTYTAAEALSASGTGTVVEILQPGEQKVVPDALAYLRGKGLQIPVVGSGGGAQGGTLRASFAGGTAETVFAGARTTSPAPVGPGRAGLSYPGPRSDEAATGKVLLFGLRENESDRTNLALVNAGTTGPITLQVTLFSGEAGDPRTFALEPVTLGPGQWRQLNTVLQTAGFVNGYASVERTSGTDPFLSYAIFNDNVTNDGSYVPPVPAQRTAEAQVVPVLVETATFESELVLANPSDVAVTASLEYFESLASPSGSTRQVTERLEPHQQRIIPSVHEYLRSKGASIGARGAASYAGALRVSFAVGFQATLVDGFAGARTGAAASGGGRYALFYPAVGSSRAATTEALVYGLQQNDASRSNLAFVNLGNSQIALQYEIFDGETRERAGGPESITLPPGGWTQVNRVLDLRPGVRNAFIRVTGTVGTSPFITYGVVNDGQDSASGTNDGSYVEMSVVR